MQETEILNIHETTELARASSVLRTFPEVLRDVQEYISKNFAVVLRDNPDENRELIKSYIGKYLEQSSVGVAGMEMRTFVWRDDRILFSDKVSVSK